MSLAEPEREGLVLTQDRVKMNVIGQAMKMSALDQVHSGLLLGAKWVAAIIWIGFVAFAVGMAFSDSLDRRTGGWVCLSVAALVAVVAAEVWIKILPGLLGLGVANALITIWQGHPPTGPSEPIPRGTSVIILLILVACSVLATSFQSRKLRILDRMALLAFLVSQVLAIAWFPSPLGFGLMLSSLLVAWAYDRKICKDPVARKSHSSTMGPHLP